MTLSLEEAIFLERLRKTRPDLLQALKKEHFIEWKTRNRAKILAGLEPTSQSKTPVDEESDIEKAVAEKTKIKAGII
jgi:hypothetical protein